MQIRIVWRRLPSTVVIFCVAAGMLNAVPSKRTPVDVRCNGDDALTQRTCAAVENGLKSSPDFILSAGSSPAELVITIPTNVDWKKVGKRTKVIYLAEFSSSGHQILGNTKGACWDHAISTCAAQIIRQLKVAARKAR